MDFSYLDKKEYRNIPLLDESQMSPLPQDDKVYIRKYSEEGRTNYLHRHKYIQINYVNKGSGVHIINNKEIEIVKGDIFIMPPYVPHAISCRDGKALEIIEFEFSTEFILPSLDNISYADGYLDFAYLEPFLVVEEEVKPRFNLDEETRVLAEDILFEALNEYKHQNKGYILIIKALLLKLLVITGRAYSSEIKGTETEKLLNKYKNVISESVEYIENNFDDAPTLDEIAASVNYSRSHFSYLFKAVTGKTYVEYLNELKIKKACDLIENTDMGITDIAFEVGFNSVSNFYRNFSVIMGQSPKKYKR